MRDDVPTRTLARIEEPKDTAGRHCRPPQAPGERIGGAQPALPGPARHLMEPVHRTAPAGVLPPTALIDRHGRTAKDLRLSVTDRCNLRCTYCMPAQGLDWLASPKLLSVEEIVRLARIGVEQLGIERIRLTGGEPLLRRDLEDIITGIAALRTRATGAKPDIGVTTNGLGLDKRAAALRGAGLDRVNVSVDSLDRATYARITRRDRLHDVLAGARAAQEAGLSPIKVNAVALPENLGEQAPALLTECLRRGWQLRFIEHMPLGPDRAWRADDVVSAAEILRILRGAGFALSAVGRPDRRPATLWRVAAGQKHPGGSVGIIASVSAPFCADCDRSRITADGRLMTCLFSSTETDLRTPLRAGATDEEIAAIWARATWNKPRAHGTDNTAARDTGFARPGRTMSAIGG